MHAVACIIYIYTSRFVPGERAFVSFLVVQISRSVGMAGHAANLLQVFHGNITAG